MQQHYARARSIVPVIAGNARVIDSPRVRL